jgi:hypothetical protein
VLDPELIPIHERLVTIRRQLVALAAKDSSHKAELKPLMEELRKIDSLSSQIFTVFLFRSTVLIFLLLSKRIDGKFMGPGGTVPPSQAVCSSLLEEAFDIAQEIKAQEESKKVATSLKPIYDRLSSIRAELESLVLTHRWSLRETDLWNYSLSLQEVDKMRVDGGFLDSEGNKPEGQYVSWTIEVHCNVAIFALMGEVRFCSTFFAGAMDLSTAFCHRVNPSPRN